MLKPAALCLALSLAAAPVWAEPLNYNVVSFSESAVATINKDLMTANLRIQEDGTNRQTVSNTVTNRLNALTARIKTDKSLKSELVGRSVYPRYNKQKIVGYTDTAYIQVESKDFQALNKLIAASQNEAALENVDFSVSAEKRSETVNNLSRQALKNFTARAQVLSDALGFGGRYKIVNINIQSDFRSYAKTAVAAAPMMARMADTQYEAAAPEMNINEPGTEEIVQTVNGSVQM
mgnify:FL=1